MNIPPNVPEALAGVALIDAKAAAATGGMSVSWWLEEVRSKRAPQPAVRATRCTRWRLSDVAEFWRKWADRQDTGVAGRAMDNARKASAAAQVRRATARA